MTAAASAPPAPGVAAQLRPLMPATARRAIGLANIAEGCLALAALVWVHRLAEGMVVAQESAGDGVVATDRVAWWGPDFDVTLATSVILVGAVGGLMGSVVQQSIVFAARTGNETLERGYVWWYVLRPVWSALLGATAVVLVNAQLISIGDETTSAAGVTVLLPVALVAGLFTDQVLQRIGGVLGASDPHGPGR